MDMAWPCQQCKQIYYFFYLSNIPRLFKIDDNSTSTQAKVIILGQDPYSGEGQAHGNRYLKSSSSVIYLTTGLM